jgi:DNA-binding SARP family transcriptional activator
MVDGRAAREHRVGVAVRAHESTSDAAAIEVCLLGNFRILKYGVLVTVRPGSKAEQLMGQLALRSPDGLLRESLIGLLWPETEIALATQSLNTLVYSMHRLLGDALEGLQPVLVQAGMYVLNVDAGVEIDIIAFETAARDGDRLAGLGSRTGAVASYCQAVALYAGDLAFGSDILALVERERLRSRYLLVLARLADLYFDGLEFERALECALDLLSHDPCREDAHRMAMRCFVRLGVRSQGLRQYRTCCEVLALEFGAVPERATKSLYELIRLDPARA